MENVVTLKSFVIKKQYEQYYKGVSLQTFNKELNYIKDIKRELIKGYLRLLTDQIGGV